MSYYDKEKKKKKFGCLGCGCQTYLVIFLIIAAIGAFLGDDDDSKDKKLTSTASSVVATKDSEKPKTQAEKPKAQPVQEKPKPAEKPKAACLDIRGNISSSGEKIYHVPSGRFYDKTEPEATFCTEAEARSAGYRKSKL
ncbi:hypothetical protein ACFQ4X_06985 [Fictibacillus halophilus]|uniref:sunset domain-containing protein n=1 Tax=Fictibacillus halophilus TaxID=1610490 RepID=UPI00362DF8A9